MYNFLILGNQIKRYLSLNDTKYVFEDVCSILLGIKANFLDINELI